MPAVIYQDKNKFRLRRPVPVTGFISIISQILTTKIVSFLKSSYYPTKHGSENLLSVIKSFAYAMNMKTLMVTGMALVVTIACHSLKLEADFPLTIISIAIVFPIVFSIRAAFSRRERALQNFADLKGNGLSIFVALRDWGRPDENNRLPEEFRQKGYELLVLIRDHFMKSDSDKIGEKKIYEKFLEISKLVQELRKFGVSGEMSRINQYVSKMMIAYTNMKIAFEYRTPITLRAYSKVFIYSFPILFGPYFASNFSHYVAVLGYVMPVVYSFILISLDNIQDHLEFPFEQLGEDDVFIDAEDYLNTMS